MSLVFGGVMLSQFTAQYWTITSQTSSEALYKAKAALEIERAAGKKDFSLASSTARAQDQDASCITGGLCYTVAANVSDLSACSKYVEADVAWQVPNYPQSETSLFTNLTDPTETIDLGGDCPLAAPAGSWDTSASAASGDVGSSATALDALGGSAYVALASAPYLAEVTSAGSVVTGDFGESVGLNAVDVARDLTTGRTYAYVARNDASAQFGIVDVTDPTRMATTTYPLALSGVTSASGQGWRVAYYDHAAYVTTRYISGQPDFHVVDVHNPAAPAELGSFKVSASIYALLVRSRIVQGVERRYAYLATTNDGKEVMILDVTDPAHISLVSQIGLPSAGCGLVNKPEGTVLDLAGETLWVGREHSPSCPSLPDLLGFDVTDPTNPRLIAADQIQIGATVVGLKISGALAFVETASQVTAPSTNLLDVDESRVWVARALRSMEVWSLDPATIHKLSSAALSHTVQAFASTL